MPASAADPMTISVIGRAPGGSGGRPPGVALGGCMIQAYDPRTGRPAGKPVPETTEAEVDALVRQAAEAFPAWAESNQRAEALEAIADALDARTDELVAIADTETALGAQRLTGEVARTTG